MVEINVCESAYQYMYPSPTEFLLSYMYCLKVNLASWRETHATVRGSRLAGPSCGGVSGAHHFRGVI
jgi:hypothetical protein